MSAPDFTLDMPVTEVEAVHLQSQGLQIAEKLPASVMAKQLKDELIRILNEGDSSSGGAFTIAVAVRVEKFVIAAREILMTEKLAKNDIGALLAMRRKGQLGMGMVGPDIYGGELMGMPIPNENFGVQAIKQMIEAAQSMSESPVKLVEALASARQLNLHDVAANIEKKLGVEKKTIAAEEKPDPEQQGGSP